MQILVLGMHRSGTSLVTRLINMMGAYFGPEASAIPPHPENPKGFWERQDVMECNDAILYASGCAWDRLAAWNLPSLPPPLASRMQYLVLGMDAFRPWVMKDPRLCITLPSWRPYLEVPVAVIVHRNPRECARSLEMRNGMRGEWAMALWEYSAVGALNASAGMPRVFVSHAEMIADPVAAVSALHAQLSGVCGVQGLRLPSEREITAFIEKQLYRSRADSGASLSPWRQSLAERMRGAIPTHETLHVSDAARAAMATP